MEKFKLKKKRQLFGGVPSHSLKSENEYATLGCCIPPVRESTNFNQLTEFKCGRIIELLEFRVGKLSTELYPRYLQFGMNGPQGRSNNIAEILLSEKL